MKIEWIGHSCFYVTLESGKTLLFDPFADSIGYSRKNTEPSYVLVTHSHYDHASMEHIEGEYTLIDRPGVFNYEQDGIKVIGINTFHDKSQGSQRGTNVVFVLEAEGIRLMHMGDIGYVPDEEFFEQAGKIDILMVPVGGVYTVDAKEALEICRLAEPNIILPMHYKTMFLQMDLDPIYKFTDAAGRLYDISRLGTSWFEITASSMKKRPRIVVMNHSVDSYM